MKKKIQDMKLTIMCDLFYKTFDRYSCGYNIDKIS